MKKALTLPLFYVMLASASFAQSGITESVNRFLATLSADERAKTQYAFTDSLRYKWTNLPVGLVPRPGIAYGSLSDQSPNYPITQLPNYPITQLPSYPIPHLPIHPISP